MIKAVVNTTLRELPLALKAVLLTTVISFIFWIIFDTFHRWNLEVAFNDFLLGELQQRASTNWVNLDAHVRSQSRVAKLLTQRKEFLDYVDSSVNNRKIDNQGGEPVRYRDLPPWFPARSVLRELIHAPGALLLDSRGGIREIYQGNDTAVPGQLLVNLTVGLESEESLETIRMVEGVVYLLTRIKVVDSTGEGRAYLVLVTPLDDDFLLSFQMQSGSDALLVFLRQDGLSVSASSRPDLVPAGTLVEVLKKHYLMQQKVFFDYGFSSDVLVEFATLIPLSRVADLGKAVSHIDRSLRTVGFAVLLLLFFGVIQWLVGRIQAFTREMLEFSKQHLGSEPERALGRDQLIVMGNQFRLMMVAIVEARRRLEEREKELTVANKALWESLVMVKRTQTKLLEAEKMAYLGGLVAGVAHEINTPLGIGITAASFLEKKCRDIHQSVDAGGLKKAEFLVFLSDARESSEMILGNLQRAAELIRSFKQVAVDQSSEEKRHFSVCEYIQQIFRSLRPRLKKTSISVTTDCPDDLYYSGFPGVLSQIITNLVENSLKHGFEPGDQGEIGLQVDTFEGNIRMFFCDSGKGMTEEVVQHIFEPFFTTARSKGGSGLGLHIVYNLVTQTLGGSISCESSPGKGARFSIVFPGTEETLNG